MPLAYLFNLQIVRLIIMLYIIIFSLSRFIELSRGYIFARVRKLNLFKAFDFSVSIITLFHN